MKPRSLMRRIDAFFTARPDEGLTLTEACAKFACTGAQFYKALDHANRQLGLGLGMEPFFRLGPSKWARNGKKRGNSSHIRPDRAQPSIFSGLAPAIRLAGGQAPDQAPLVVVRSGGIVRVSRLVPQETQEWKEREAARRARQKPPRPTAKAKTRGKKVRAWDGESSVE